MIRVCILSHAVNIIKSLLTGFEIVEDNPDVIVSDQPMNISKPVVVYDDNQDLGEEIIKAKINKMYKPLNDSIHQALEAVRKDR